MIRTVLTTQIHFAFLAAIVGCASASDGNLDGGPCQVDADCSGGVCGDWFADKDGDGHGDPSTLIRLCAASTRLEDPNGGFLVTVGDDCCDAARDVHPGQTQFFSEPQSVCGDHDPSGSPILVSSTSRAFDYDCDGVVTSDHRLGPTQCNDLAINECETSRILYENVVVCGGFHIGFACVAEGGGCSYGGSLTELYDPISCR